MLGDLDDDLRLSEELPQSGLGLAWLVVYQLNTMTSDADGPNFNSSESRHINYLHFFHDWKIPMMLTIIWGDMNMYCTWSSTEDTS